VERTLSINSDLYTIFEWDSLRFIRLAGCTGREQAHRDCNGKQHNGGFHGHHHSIGDATDLRHNNGSRAERLNGNTTPAPALAGGIGKRDG
jgi:hypothetical protein